MLNVKLSKRSVFVTMTFTKLQNSNLIYVLKRNPLVY
jgi:hypothetical protein